MAKVKLSRCKQKQQVNREINDSLKQIEENKKIVSKELELLALTAVEIFCQWKKDREKEEELKKQKEKEEKYGDFSYPDWTEDEYLKDFYEN